MMMMMMKVWILLDSGMNYADAVKWIKLVFRDYPQPGFGLLCARK